MLSDFRMLVEQSGDDVENGHWSFLVRLASHEPLVLFMKSRKSLDLYTKFKTVY